MHVFAITLTDLAMLPWPPAMLWRSARPTCQDPLAAMPVIFDTCLWNSKVEKQSQKQHLHGSQSRKPINYRWEEENRAGQTPHHHTLSAFFIKDLKATRAVASGSFGFDTTRAGEFFQRWSQVSRTRCFSVLCREGMDLTGPLQSSRNACQGIGTEGQGPSRFLPAVVRSQGSRVVGSQP